VEPAIEKVPTTQLEQLAEEVLPDDAKYFPEIQRKQLVEPTSGWYVPAGQLLQILAPKTE